VLCLLLLQLQVEVLEVLLCGGAALLVSADGGDQALCLLLQRLQECSPKKQTDMSNHTSIHITEQK
jgi:hypothetical protein